MKGIILAGGKGKRLGDLTTYYPKPLLPLLDKPVLAYNIELLKKHDVHEIAILIQHYGTEIKRYFGDGSQYGVHITYIEDNPPLGTAGSVKSAQSFIGSEDFIVVSGDVFTDFDLRKGMTAHINQGPICTIFLTKVLEANSFGVVDVDQNGYINKFIEKPSTIFLEPQYVNTGIYVCSPRIFSYIQENKFVDFGHDVFPSLLQNEEKLLGYYNEGFWIDVGDIERFHRASMEVLGKNIHVKLHVQEVEPYMWIGKNIEIGDNVSIKPPVYIGDNVKIGSNAKIYKNTIIGKNSIIDENAVIEEESVLQSRYYLKRENDDKGQYKLSLSFPSKEEVDQSTENKNGEIAKR